jgi:transposase
MKRAAPGCGITPGDKSNTLKEEQPMKKIAYVGVDYHLNSLSIAVVVEGQRKLHDTIRLKNDHRVILRYMEKLSRDYEIKACYEASTNGYAFQRKMNHWGYHCDVIAPSLIPKKKGDRRKNDFRDARDLAQNYAAGMLSIVHPPSEEQEAVRSLIRCRMAFKDAERRTKFQINSLLLAQDLRWPRSKWTFAHRQWLAGLQLPSPYLQEVLEEHLGHLSYIENRLTHLDGQIEEIARSEVYAPNVTKLRAFKGIGTLAAMLLIAEITDFRRFANPRALMAFLGLIPSENSSGDKRVDGSITKAGNRRCRTQLIESIQHYVRGPHITLQMKCDLSKVDPFTANAAIKCLKRLNKRYWTLITKGKLRPIAITAIAREFVGFIWAVMQPQPHAV